MARFVQLATLIALLFSGCDTFLHEVGGRDQPCLDNGTCEPGLVCAEGICCLQSCDGRECGDDGCGGSCGVCEQFPNSRCNEDRACECKPVCGTNSCGSDGCGGACGSCSANAECDQGQCVCLFASCSGVCCPEDQVCNGAGQCCERQCDGKDCGPDACNGVCGVCSDFPNSFCDEGSQTCDCQPVCTGLICGGDGCGGSCGNCGVNELCQEGTACVCAFVECDGTCCDQGQVCHAGTCCTPTCDGKDCGDDTCGGSCGQCLEYTGSYCNQSFQCACQADCTGKQCGDNECGGSCGQCPDHPNSFCDDSFMCDCAANCTNKQCGPDGCGGSCGTCDAYPTSYCDPSYQCGCTPDCTGILCGNDGCGGMCDACQPLEVCDVDRCLADMTTVLAGTFAWGCQDPADPDCSPDEFPATNQDLSEFEVAVTEVTNRQYALCVNAGTCTEPSDYAAECTYSAPGSEDLPVNCVTWQQAKQYCAWAGRRLCTEAEWEKAARGSDGRNYPWGYQNADCSLAVMSDGTSGCGQGRPWEVGSIPAGASPPGALDMAGNVFEYVHDWYHAAVGCGDNTCSQIYGPYEGTDRVRRGGSYMNQAVDLRTTARSHVQPDLAETTTGIRCCRSPQWCGDGITDPPEECDDGNDIGLDGCSSCDITEFQISYSIDTSVQNIEAAVNSSGRTVIAWIELTSLTSEEVIWSQVLDATGAAVGSPFLIEPTETTDPSELSVGIDDAGRSVITWKAHSREGCTRCIWARRLDANGQPLGDTFLVNRNHHGWGYRPHVHMEADGSFGIIWQDSAWLYLRRWGAAGEQLTGELEIKAPTQAAVWASSAHDGLGNYLLVWGGPVTGGYEVLAQKFDTNGASTGPEFPVYSSTSASSVVLSSALASDASFWVLLRQYLNTPELRRFDASGIPVDAAQQLGIASTEINQFSLQMSADGSAAVCMLDSDPTRAFSCIRYNTDGSAAYSLSPPLATEPILTCSHGLGPNGRHITLWAASTHDRQGFAQRFTTAGEAIGRGAW